MGTLPQVLVKMPRNSQCEELPHDNMDEKCKYNVVYLTNWKTCLSEILIRSKCLLAIKSLLNMPLVTDQIMIKKQDVQDRAVIMAESVWGILRGLESFTQLVYSTKENGYVVSNFIMEIVKVGHVYIYASR